MGKMIYLDNAATTRTAPEVVEAMSINVRKMVKGEYNAQTTSAFIINDFIRLTANKKNHEF